MQGAKRVAVYGSPALLAGPVLPDAPHCSLAIAPGAALIAYERQDGRLD